jgi:FkbM family methyltransferase
LQSCKLIYLDLGSNIGVQIRKFYEPEKYPKATVLPLFAQHFGKPAARRDPKSGVCVLGLEPNPEHYARLAQVEAAYLKRGWHVHFYRMAAWSKNGQMVFKGAGEEPSHKDWGARLEMHAARYEVEVPTVDIAAFVRSLPANSVKLMKMDIEGAEYECISHMIWTSTLCASVINSTFVEAHAWGNVGNWAPQYERSFDSIAEAVRHETKCTGPVTKVINLDDESYLHDVDDDFGEGHPLTATSLPKSVGPASTNGQPPKKS